MKCVRCGTDLARYVQRRDEFQKKGSKGAMVTFKRTDFTVKCKKCGVYDEQEYLSQVRNGGN
jgi:hypothetical protein